VPVAHENASSKIRYERWLWEALKTIGAASVAAILALQLKLSTVAEQIAQTKADIGDIKTALKEIEHRDGELHKLILDNKDYAGGERRELERKVESVKDMINEHQRQMLQIELEKNRKR